MVNAHLYIFVFNSKERVSPKLLAATPPERLVKITVILTKESGVRGTVSRYIFKFMIDTDVEEYNGYYQVLFTKVVCKCDAGRIFCVQNKDVVGFISEVYALAEGFGGVCVGNFAFEFQTFQYLE